MSKKILLTLACTLAVIAALIIAGRQRLAAQGPGTTTLVFGFVTSQLGLDTQIVITNASATPFGNNPTIGTCGINYFGTNTQGATPGIQTTSSVPAGGQISFTLSRGGSGVSAAPAFQGYIVAACNFPLAQGVAAISDQGGSKFLSYLQATVLPAF